MKRLFVAMLVFGLFLVFARVGYAADLSLSFGLELQSGDYDWEGKEVLYEATADAPLWRLSVLGNWGNWYGSAFYTAGEGEGSHDLMLPSDPSQSPWSNSSSYGADLGYTFTFGGLTIRPLLGYRQHLFAAGVEVPNPSASQKTCVGVKVEGIRLGAEAAYALGDALTVRAGLGVLVNSEIKQFQESRVIGVYPGVVTIASFDNPDADTTCLDGSLAVDYALSESVRLTLGYRFLKGDLEMTSDPIFITPRTEFSSGVFFLGAAYTF